MCESKENNVIKLFENYLKPNDLI